MGEDLRTLPRRPAGQRLDLAPLRTDENPLGGHRPILDRTHDGVDERLEPGCRTDREREPVRLRQVPRENPGEDLVVLAVADDHRVVGGDLHAPPHLGPDFDQVTVVFSLRQH